MEQVEKLRAKQEAYVASLPKEPVEALSEINRALKDPRENDSPQSAARSALTIIQELSTSGALDGGHQINEAIYWLTVQGLDGLKVTERGTLRAMSIAGQFEPRYEPYKA